MGAMLMSVVGAVVAAIALTTQIVAADIIVPIDGEITRRFEAPPCPYCAGHRGVTVSTRVGDDIVAISDGVVTFAGEVGGLVYVVQRIAPDVRVTYGWVSSLAEGVVEGKLLERGTSIAVAAESMYLGVRVGDQYVEPLRYLGLGRVRLHGAGGVTVSERSVAR